MSRSSGGGALVIRPAEARDFDAIWTIFRAVVSRGDTYAYRPDSTPADAQRLWMADTMATYVAERDGRIVGTYMMKANQPGLGDHVANAGFMVAPDGQGRGIGTAMAEHAIAEARTAGYQAMQFNLVVSTNRRAVRLWQRLGFTIVATLPRAFRHRPEGLVDAHVMHRFL